MSGFTTVLIVGSSGLVGDKVTNAFLKATPKWTVSVLVRSEALHDPKKKATFDEYISLGATIIEGEASKPETYKDKLKAIDVIVSTLGSSVVTSQISLAQAAKEAGVKLFLPSEYGFDFALAPELTIFDGKRAVRKAIESIGINYTYIITGGFYEFLLGWRAWGQDLPHRKVAQLGDRSNKITSVSFAEVAELLPAVVNDPTIINKTVVFTGGHITSGELVDTLVAKLGGGDDIKKEVITLEEVENKVKAGSVLDQLLLVFVGNRAYNPNAIDGSKYGKKLSTFKEFASTFDGPYF